jgi:hypothetical protein
VEYLGLYNKPKAEMHLGHKLMGPKEEEEVEKETYLLHNQTETMMWLTKN